MGLLTGEMEEIVVPESKLEIWVPAHVHGESASMLLDTGTSHTIVTFEMYIRIPESRRPRLDPPNVILRQAAGSEVNVWGRLNVDILVGRRAAKICVVVAQVTNNMLGMDFLRATRPKLDFDSLQLQWSDSVVQCGSTRGDVTPPRLLAANDMEIPPGYSAVVSAVVSGMRSQGALGVVEPLGKSDLLKRGLLVARCVVKSQDGVVPVTVANVGDRPRTIAHGTTLGKIMTIDEDEVCETRHLNVEPGAEKDGTTLGEMPIYLEELARRSTEDMEEVEKEMVESLLVRYQDVFSSSEFDIGRTTWVKHSINTGDAAPVRQPLRRSSPQQRAEVERQVHELLAKGLIEPSNSPWSSPVVLVSKKDGSKRLCLDYRKLNMLSRKDAYPLPRIDDSLDALGGAKFFSTLDLASGYWQVEMDEDARDKSAFSTPSGLYAWNVLPFGLCNAPSTFERLMERVLAGLRWETLLVYLDDVIVFGSSIQESVERLEAVLIRLRMAGLKLKPSKCNLFQKRVCYLGHVVSEEGIHTDPAKIESVKSWPRPVTTTQVRSFLGLASYYRRFIKGFAGIAAPLHHITKKNVIFDWTAGCEDAFEVLKGALVSAPILAYPRPEGQYYLDTDASAFAIGGVLSQEQDGAERVIAYGSLALSKEEKNYCVTRRELLAIVMFLKKFRHYLGGTCVKVRTDHGSLRWLCNFKNPEGQLARWLEVLASFHVELEFRPGKNHQNADGLSRRPCKQCGRMEARNAEKEMEEGHADGQEDLTPQLCEVGCQTDNPEGKRSDLGDHGSQTAEDVSSRMLVVENQQSDQERTQGVESSDTDVQVWLQALAEFYSENAMDDSDDFVETEVAVDSYLARVKAGLSDSVDVDASYNSDESSRPDTEPAPVCRECTIDDLSQQSSDQDSEVIRSRRVGAEPEISFAMIREKQLQDETIAHILVMKEKGKEKPEWEDVSPLASQTKTYWAQWELLAVKEGVLTKSWESNDGKSRKWLIVLPKSLRGRVMDELHASKAGGHLGRNKLLAKLKERYYWAGMSADVRAYLRQCVKCAQKKGPQRKFKAPLQQYKVGAPLERIAVDVLGPLPLTENGNEYILVIGDYWTKWMETYAVPDQQAETVAAKLVEEFVCRFGVPLELHSDQGRNFESQVFTEMCRILGIEKTRTTAYNPKSDGMVERYNRTIVNSVSLMIEPHRNQRDWDRYLPFVGFAYRASVQESTGESPNMMMLGREVHLPVDLVVGGTPHENECETDYAETLREIIREVHLRARGVVERSAKRQKRNYDRGTRGPVFEEGQFVWLHDTQRRQKLSKKLSLPWQGPYLVVKALSAVTFRIQKSKKGKTKVVHADRLKLYEGPSLVKWKYRGPARVHEESPQVHVVESEIVQPQRTADLEAKGGSGQPNQTKEQEEAGKKDNSQPGTITKPGGASHVEGATGEKTEGIKLQSCVNNGDKEGVAERRNPSRVRKRPLRYR